MSYISTNSIKNSTIMLLFSEREAIQLDPSYQRMGGVWTKEKKQLLIDSILNDYDIPKIYFHVFDKEKSKESGFDYAVIDGRQRLETIWAFINGEFPLADDFEYQKDESIKLAKLSYNDIAQEYPKIKIKFDSFVLPVIGVETDDDELIEDMFSRLNEAAPLNAAEKRNAIGGNLVKSIRKISEHIFFTERVSFGNKRYQHREVASRFLLIEDSLLQTPPKLVDTKKVYLDALARKYATDNPEHVASLESEILNVMNHMCSVFMKNDELLRSQGNIGVYYLLFRSALQNNEVQLIRRTALIDFQLKLRENRIMAAEKYEESSFELLEYDRLTQQGTNDASNIKERLNVIREFLGLSSYTV